MPRCYLDYNATAPVRPAVIETVAAAMAEVGNPSSVHGSGRAARKRVEQAREQVAALVGAQPGGVVFTASGTEANALALQGRGRVLVSAVEHGSVLRNIPGADLVPVDGDGVIDLLALEQMLAAGRGDTLVSVMLANNETGVIQPVAEVAEVAHRHGALVHCDAVQAAGKLPVDIGVLGVDLLSLSAHKLGGPQGVGALVLDEFMDVDPMIRGGGQERGRRAGTENVAGIAGFGVAAVEAVSDLGRLAGLARWRDRLEAGIRALAPVRLFGAGAERLPNTSCFSLAGVTAQVQLMHLDLAGIEVSSGSACSSGKVGPSHVLRAMGVPEEEQGAIRVSLGWASLEEDVERFLEAWGALLRRLRTAA